MKYRLFGFCHGFIIDEVFESKKEAALFRADLRAQNLTITAFESLL